MAARLDPKKRIGREDSSSIKEVGLSIDDNLKAMEDMASSEFVVRDIAIEKIVPSKRNFFEVSDIKDLAEDIRENGLSHNLLVRGSFGKRITSCPMHRIIRRMYVESGIYRGGLTIHSLRYPNLNKIQTF